MSTSKNKYANLLKINIPFPGNKFVMYTRGRTGSTVLTDLLNCHPQIFCDVEIFNFLYSKAKVGFPYLYINSCSKRAAIYNKEVYGFKVKISQLVSEHEYSDHDKLLTKLYSDGWKFIYLKRNNHLRLQLSNYVAADTNIYHIKKGDEKKPVKVRVDCNDLLTGIRQGEEIAKAEEENLKNIPHLTLSYETDIMDNTKHQETADKVFSYLGLSSAKVTTDLKRIVPDSLRDTIQNYEEVYRSLKETEYLKYLTN